MITFKGRALICDVSRQGSDISGLSVIHSVKLVPFISAVAFEVGFMEKNFKDVLQSY